MPSVVVDIWQSRIAVNTATVQLVLLVSRPKTTMTPRLTWDKSTHSKRCEGGDEGKAVFFTEAFVVCVDTTCRDVDLIGVVVEITTALTVQYNQCRSTMIL